MRDSKPQRCVQQHKLLKVTRNATNRDRHINEASKQFFFPTVCSKLHVNTRKVWFPFGKVLSICSIYENLPNVSVF